jgi:hypothetical protein
MGWDGTLVRGAIQGKSEYVYVWLSDEQIVNVLPDTEAPAHA